MTETGLLHALRSFHRPRGVRSIALNVGEWQIVLDGLDDLLAGALERRWEGFVGPARGGTESRHLRVVRGEGSLWLPHWRPFEQYRIEGVLEGGVPLAHSYHFALAPDADSNTWRFALADDPDEPVERVVENVVRYMVARAAAEAGGFALHGAGVLREERAYVFAGPSRSGKSTAVALSAPARSLGDDFAVLLPGGAGWLTPALPFDSSEKAPPKPQEALFPVAGIWRLYQAAEPRLEPVAPTIAAASLMGCAAFPWAMPDLSEAVLEHVRRYVEGAVFAHLHFRKAPDFWDLLE
jgi:hypothetical protein